MRSWNAEIRGLIHDWNPAGAAALALVLDHAQEVGWDPEDPGDYAAVPGRSGSWTFYSSTIIEGSAARKPRVGFATGS